MFSKSKVSIAAAAALLVPALSAQAVIVFGPNGLGGINAYERVDIQVNFATAITNSQIAFAGAPLFGVPASGTIGHLSNYSSSADYEFQAVTMRAGAPQNVYIGLTDNVAFTAGAFEGGNSSGGALHANGTAALATERGAGFAFVGSNALSTFHQRTPGVSVWGGGEPNGGGGENVAEIRGDGFLNDINEGSTRPFIREWDLNLAAMPVFGPLPGTPGLVVTDIRNVGGVTNGNYQGIAAAPPGGAVVAFALAPTINFGGGGNFGGDQAFPQGGGDNFVVKFDGFIKIPVAGAYTFLMNQDDTIRIQIGTNGAPAIFEDQGCCNNTFTTLNLDAGLFPISVLFAEFGGGENVELSAVLGANITNIAQFRLLGDTANGGLALFTSPPPVPEPATAMLGMIGVSLMGLRRRRNA